MDARDVEFLRLWLREAPQWQERIRLDPPELLRGGSWSPISAVRTVRDAIQLSLEGGRRVSFPIDEARRAAQRSPVFWQGILKHFFPRARVRRILAETDRVRHQTGALVRLLVREAGRWKTLIWVRPEESEEARERLLSALLLWWDELQHLGPDSASCFVPWNWSLRIVSQLSHLEIAVRCYRYLPAAGRGRPRLERIYPAPPSASRVQAPYVIFPRAEGAPRPLRALGRDYPQLRSSRRAAGWELDFLGLPVAWSRGGEDCFYDLSRPKVLREEDCLAFRRHLEHVERIRCFPSPEPRHPFFTWKPERWLERQVLRDHRLLEPDFCRHVYSQVPTCVDGDRRILDLLTSTRSGRLAVIELKVCQDLNIVFQSLEYWSRVGVHLQQRDFQNLGYFPSLELQLVAPLLYLVCPLFEYHRVLPVFRRYVKGEVRFRCVGINSDWRRELKVIRRFDF